jgi:nitroreductase
LFGMAEEFNRARPKIEGVLREGRAFHSRPTAILFVIGDKRTPLSEASAQYAIANMMFYAQVKGVGTCAWANGPMFIDKNRAVRRQLGLGRHERIFGALNMGYPAIRFSNKVGGKELPIQWNGVLALELG